MGDQGGRMNGAGNCLRDGIIQEFADGREWVFGVLVRNDGGGGERLDVERMYSPMSR